MFDKWYNFWDFFIWKINKFILIVLKFNNFFKESDLVFECYNCNWVCFLFMGILMMGGEI